MGDLYLILFILICLLLGYHRLLVFVFRKRLIAIGFLISSKSKISIRENLKYIFAFPIIRDRLRLSFKEFFFLPTKEFYKLCKIDIEGAMKMLIKHCGLKDNISIKITHDKLIMPCELAITGQAITTDAAGITYCISPFQYTVWVNKDCNVYMRGTTLAHELSHIYILSNGLKFQTQDYRKNQFQEQMADLFTVVLGYGLITLKGMESDFLSFDARVDYNRVGYLKENQIMYAQNIMEKALRRIRRHQGRDE